MIKHAALMAAAVLLPLTVLPATTSSASPSPTTAARPAVSSTATPATPAASAYADWPGYHGGGTKPGYAITVKHPTVTPKQVWSIGLDGAVYGQPIIVDHGITIAATENNSVYRLSGNSVVWRRNLGAPVPQSALPCGDIDPSGITGTPGYDASTNTVVVVSLLNSPIRHIATGLDPVTGAVRWSRTVDVPASVPGISPQAMQQRGGLLVSGRRVYVPYGALAGDCSSYRGSVVGLDLDHPTTATLWDYTVASPRQGGIWNPVGPVDNPGGGILVAVGNGSVGATGAYDYTNAVLKLANQQVQDYFAPSNWRDNNAGDVGLGSQGPQIVGNYVFVAGKSGPAYVLRRDKLGSIGGQVSIMDLCKSFGGAATVGNVVYVPCTDGVRAGRINSNGSMTVLWHAPSNVNGTPTVAGGLVWALDYAGGVLHALNPSSGANVYSLTTGATNRFAAPAAYGNAVFVGTLSGVKAFNW